MRSASTVGATPGLAGEKTRRRWPIARCLRQSTSSTTSTKCVVPSMAGVPPGSVGAASDAAGLSHSHCGGDEDRRRYRQQLVQKPQHATVTGTSACSASARSTVALRCRIGASAFSTLIRQCPLTPSCGVHSPYRGENSGPARHITESLTSIPELENSLGEQRKHVDCVSCVDQNGCDSLTCREKRSR